MLDLNCVTHICVCGSRMWQLDWVIFDDFEISAHSYDMTCKFCGATAIAPTLPDKPDENNVTV